MTHVQKTERFGVLSPFRKENSDKENEENYKELSSLVRKMGYGYIALKGGYVGDEGFFPEKSLFIPNIKRKEMLELGKKYDQHSVLHKDKDNFAMIGTNKAAGVGKVFNTFDTKGKNINIDDIGDKFKDFFSKLVKGSHKGKKFSFKMEERIETSMYYERRHGSQWETIFVQEGEEYDEE